MSQALADARTLINTWERKFQERPEGWSEDGPDALEEAFDLCRGIAQDDPDRLVADNLTATVERTWLRLAARVADHGNALEDEAYFLLMSAAPFFLICKNRPLVRKISKQILKAHWPDIISSPRKAGTAA